MRLFPRSRDPSGFSLLEFMVVIALVAVLAFWTSPASAWAPEGAPKCALAPAGISDAMTVPTDYAGHFGNIDNSRSLFDAYARAPEVFFCQALAPTSQHYNWIYLQDPQTLTRDFTNEQLVATTGVYASHKDNGAVTPFSGAIHLAQSDLYSGANFDRDSVGNV